MITQTTAPDRSGLTFTMTANNKNHPNDAANTAQATAQAKAQDLIKNELAQVESILRSLPDLQPQELRQAVEVVVSSGGKRIRPVIALLTAGMLQPQIGPRAIHLASAVEMLHTATLVHDDLIDGALMRRGAATLNAAWTPAATVLTGDYLFSFAAGLAAKTDSVRVMSIFSETLGVIVGGELRQQFTSWAQRSTREDYTQRIYAKTASMFVLATSATGVISNASETQIAELERFGRELGNAFQVIDDILDFTGEQASVGKPVGSDLRRGLITLPTICYIESQPNDPRLECALKNECDSETYDGLIATIRNSPAIHAAQEEARRMVDQAKHALTTFSDNPYKTALLAIADYTVNREI